jgi:hypothetical protein
MSRRCSVCIQARIGAINERLRASNRAPIVRIAAEFGITRDALTRHAARHAPLAEESPQEAPPIDRRHFTRAARHGVKTDARQRFLEAYARSGNLSQSAAAAGVGRRTVYTWQEHDQAFALAFNEAEAQAVEALEAVAHQRATAGARIERQVWRDGKLIETVIEYRPSDPVLLTLLKALKPDKYRERIDVTQTQVVKTIEAAAWEAV